jgi:hypothetical protein
MPIIPDIPIDNNVDRDIEKWFTLYSKLKLAIKGFEVLAKLGNGSQYGNSIGNTIAQDYLKKLKGE